MSFNTNSDFLLKLLIFWIYGAILEISTLSHRVLKKKKEDYYGKETV